MSKIKDRNIDTTGQILRWSLAVLKPLEIKADTAQQQCDTGGIQGGNDCAWIIWFHSRKWMEASPGIEPGFKDLQSSA
jgi:hypothetical protein